MAMTDLQINRSGRTGKSLPFTADFIKVQSIELKVIDPQPGFIGKAAVKVKKGKQTTGDPKSEETVSTIKNFYNKTTRSLNVLQ